MTKEDLSGKEQLILEELIENHRDHSEDPTRYVRQVDICNMYNISKSTLNYPFQKLKDKNMIKRHKEKTKTLTYSNKSEVYILTKKGIEAGGLVTEFENISGGPEEDTPLNSMISLEDLHDLLIKFKVNEVPDEDPIDWKEIPLNSGVTQKIRTIWKAGEQITIELFDSKENPTVCLKPHLLAGQHETAEDLLEGFKQAAYKIRTEFEMAGYELGMGDMNGEGKFTMRCSALEDIGYFEGENVLFDESKGEQDIHPRTGDRDANKFMTEMMTNKENLTEKLEPLSTKEKIEMIEEIGELSKLITNTKETKKTAQKNNKITRMLVEYVSELSQSVKKQQKTLNTLLDALNDEQLQEQEWDTPEEPPGGMFG